MKLVYYLFCSIVCCSCVLAGPYVQDNANVLTSDTKTRIQSLAAALHKECGVSFLFRTEEEESLSRFEKASRSFFSSWVKSVPSARGILVFLQLEKGTRQGIINISFGYGLKGSYEERHMQRILNEKLLTFCNDLSRQEPLVQGVGELFEHIRGHFARRSAKAGVTEDAPSPGKGLLNRDRLWVALLILLGSLLVTIVIFFLKKRKCPQCGARLHVNIRPTVRGESRYRRLKIIKCLDCNYYKKYLF